MNRTASDEIDLRRIRNFILSGIGGILGVIFLCAVTFGGCFRTTVNPGEVGVEVRFGKTLGAREPGMYATILSNITPLSTRTQTYTMAGAGQEAAVNGSVQVLSKDQLPVVLDVSVMFHLNERRAIDVFRNFGANYDDQIVHPLVRTDVRDAASEFAALDLIDKRAELQARMNVLVREKLAETLAGRGVNRDAIIIDGILIRNINLPESLDASIAAVQQQRMAAATSTQANITAQQEAARALTIANGAAAANTAQATAQANILRIQSESQAAANLVLSRSLTPEFLAYERIQATRAVLASSGTRTVFLPSGMTPNMLMNSP